MRYQFLVFFVFITGISFSQTKDTLSDDIAFNESEAIAIDTTIIFSRPALADYSKVDAYVMAMHKKYKSIPALAKDLGEPFKTEPEKVRAIFMWIANNIAYDCSAYHSKNKGGFSVYYGPNESKAVIVEKWEKCYMSYATSVLRSKKGICEGYSRLFYELCRLNGIHCKMVVGNASSNKMKIDLERMIKNFPTNHAWNEVQIDGKWYYADLTWASGYCDSEVKKFYKKFQEYYFLTPETDLFYSHAENIRQTKRKNELLGIY